MKRKLLSLITAVLVGGMFLNPQPAEAQTAPTAVPATDCTIVSNPPDTYTAAPVIVTMDPAKDVVDHYVVTFDGRYPDRVKETGTAKAAFRVSRSYKSVFVIGYDDKDAPKCRIAGEYVIASSATPPRPAASKAKAVPAATPSFGMGTMQGDEVGEILPVLPVTRCKQGTVQWKADGTWECDKELVPYDVVGQDEFLAQGIATAAKQIAAVRPGWFSDVGSGVGWGSLVGAGVCAIGSAATGFVVLPLCVSALSVGAGGGAATGAIVQLSR